MAKPQSVARNNRRHRQRLEEGNKKRRSAAGRKAKQSRVDREIRQRQIALEEMKTQLLSDVLPAQGEVARAQHTVNRAQEALVQGVFQFANGQSPNAAVTDVSSAPPASIDVSSEDSTEDLSLLSEDSSLYTSRDDVATAQPSARYDPPRGATAAIPLNGERIPKRRRIEDARPFRHRLSDVYRENPSALERAKLSNFDFEFDVVMGQRALYRLRVHGGINTPWNYRGGTISVPRAALQLMGNGEIKANPSPKHSGLMVSYTDWRDVEHQFPLQLLANGRILVTTYMARSPFRHSRRREMMLQDLNWLSWALNVPFPLIGEYIARAIDSFDRCHELLYGPCPGLPNVMEVIERILPTWEEIDLLDFPHASEMGEPENWIVAIGKIRNAAKKVTRIREFLRGAFEIEQEDWVRN